MPVKYPNKIFSLAVSNYTDLIKYSLLELIKYC